MNVRGFFLIIAPALSLLLTGCQNLPPPYAPPEQRVPLPDFRSYRVARMVDMADGDVRDHVVSDILGDTGSWRWTGKRPAVKVVLRGNQNIRYLIDFTIADATYKTTGPVMLTFFINDHVLDTVRYDKPGTQHFEKLVPAGWVVPDKETIVGAEIDKVWVSPDDGAKLGFILTRVGLTE
ncbi:MAG: hypothetical protein ABI811_23260 [Acidobacteriota bacterium]